MEQFSKLLKISIILNFLIRMLQDGLFHLNIAGK